MTLDRNQHVSRINLPEIHESQRLLILINPRSRNFSDNKATKNALAKR